MLPSSPGSLLRLAICTIVVFLAQASLPAQDAEEVFRSANADFEQGEFEQAALKYESLVQAGLLSADLFYNLGTTLYRLDRSGEAMLYLRRAQVVDPTLPEARQNIEVLRSRTAFLEFSDTDFDRIVRTLPIGFGRLVGGALLWLGAIAIVIGYSVPRLRPNRSGLITLAIVLGMLSIVAFRIDHHRAARLDPGSFSIVVAEGASALTSPTPDASAVIELPPGSEVRVIQESGPWSYIDIPDQLRGWVRAEQIARVWPIGKDA